MDEEKYQKELFEFEKPKRFFPKLSDFFPKGDFERNIILTLTLDRAVFIAIGIIMVMVVLYALGVETGKSRAMESALSLPAPAAMPQAAKVAVAQPLKVVAPQPVRVVTPAPAVSNANRIYTIVAVTFINKDTAMQETDKLRRQGYSPALIQSDRYFQVCIGAYADRTGAESQRDLKKIRRLYKDAYLRIR